MALVFGVILISYLNHISDIALKPIVDLRDVTLDTEKLRHHGEEIAKTHEISNNLKSPKILLNRVKENYKRLLKVYQYLNEKSRRRENLSAASEWILDNFYLIEEIAKETEVEISKKRLGKLQILDRGYLKGYPRIYIIALELISHTDGRLEKEDLIDFISSYQKQRVLSMTEIWSLPLMMRVALLEYLRYLADKIYDTEQSWDEAENKAILEGKEQLVFLQKQFNNQKGIPSSSFLEHLIREWRRKSTVEEELQSWLEQRLLDLGISLEELVEQEHFEQASRKITVGHAIVSLKKISRLEWDEIFESLSKVETILLHDPDEIYANMAQASRSYYRHQITSLAKKYQVTETRVARLAVGLAKEALQDKPRERHVGYYLIAEGKNKLISLLGGKGSLSVSKNKRGIFYVTAILAFMIISLFPLLNYFDRISDGNLLVILGVVLLALIPASEIGIFITNTLAASLIKPTHLPKMALREGIPEDETTMVVIPCLLPNRAKVEEMVSNLEIYYLANKETNLYFALAGDFPDAREASLEEDKEIIEAGLEEVAKLNQLYGDGKNIFFFAQRERKFSNTQNQWTGWERKRGALLEFNQLLLEEGETGYKTISPGFPQLMGKISNVITLDGDTRLTLGMAKKLIGTIAHPLNRGLVDEKKGVVKEGYGLIQPRIGIGIEDANQSIFTKLFAGVGGIDPYTTAVSDIYQDLFQEGIFTGKGIYDLKIFHHLLKDVIPQGSILSHDLLEGSFVRTGLVTDLELIDGYPSTYNSFATRLHRWTRGDWQLLPWLFPIIFLDKGKKLKNPLNGLSKWKIFDNLRRSLLPISQLLLMLVSFIWLPGNPLIPLSFALTPLILPLINDFIQALRSAMPNYSLVSLRDGFYRFILLLAFLPHRAALLVDAISRTIYRLLVSRKFLLEWVTAADAEKIVKNDLAGFIKRMQSSLWIAAFTLLGLLLIKPLNFSYTIPFILLWFGAPWLGFSVSKKVIQPEKQLDHEEQKILRRLARRTWAYYEDFAGEENNFLPPDNFQLNPANGLALRTSPTNIGFLLLAILSARDFGYLTTTGFVKRVRETISTIDKMETWKGHLFNWYHTATLEPLRPFFISTVDSGNLAGYLLVVEQGLKEYLEKPLWGNELFRGLGDTFNLGFTKETLPSGIEKRFQEPLALSGMKEALDELKNLSTSDDSWQLKFKEMVSAVSDELSMLLPKETVLDKIKILLEDGLIKETGEKPNQIIGNQSLRGLKQFYQSILEQSIERKLALSEEELKEIERALSKVKTVIEETENLLEDIQNIFNEMDFRPLYNDKKDLFAIGYSKEEEKLTDSYYDLLASEARLISYLAVCKGEVPKKHWFKLGRSLALVGKERGLVSWTGTMFEYLMPSLVMKHFGNTLLAETYQTVLFAQENYGKQRMVPWGTSESGYYGFDLHLNYQYKAFGVPDLGLKRGLIDDMVVSPYSTLLALPFDPTRAMSNISRLLEDGLEGQYGFYEAIDYTPERLPAGENKKVVESFMAHHLGMSMTALNNFFHWNIMQRRFHSNPMVRCGEILLEERVPLKVIITKEIQEYIGPFSETEKEIVNPVRQIEINEQVLPNCHILSNGRYFLLITDRGGGYSKREDVQITRWRSDLIEGNYGFQLWIKSLETNRVWSPTFEPLREEPDHYRVSFSLEKAVFNRTDDLIATHTEIVVAPEDDVEIRRVTISNNSPKEVVLELTSYGELVLGDQNGDLAHPAFSNLFIKTEAYPEEEILLASRRPRSRKQESHWAFHGVLVEGEAIGQIQFETNRGNFLGRNRFTTNPEALEKTMKGITGTVLDPIFSLRRRVKIPPNQSTSINWFFGYGEDRETALGLARKYRSLGAIYRAFEMAKTRSQVEAHFLDLTEEQITLFDDLLPHLLFNSPLKINQSQSIKENSKGQSALWAYGISGDLPIILVTVETKADIAVVKELLRAHEYWRVKGLAVDLVILNEDRSQYLQPMQDLLRETISASYSRHLLESPGGIYLRNAVSMPKEDQRLLYTAAKIVLSGKQSIRAQLRYHDRKLPSKRLFTKEIGCYKELEETVDLQLWNGYGGFANDGKEYVIRLREGVNTPAPWINVIANQNFGFQVSESGSGYIWAENSRENKLTPWSNDPVTDPINEVIYLRDDETGAIWTITPLPIREDSTYTIHHGLGYTRFHRYSYDIEQEQILLVPEDDPVKISLVNLTNNSTETKNLSLYYYFKPVLGVHWEITAPYLVTEYDETNEVFKINNSFQGDFPKRKVFVASSEKISSFTGERKEFIGEKGNLSEPQAVTREGLSNRTGAGLDACGALQIKLTLNPGEKKELVFLLGQGKDIQEILNYVETYRNPANAKRALKEVTQFWEELLSRIQIRTPDPTMDLLMNNWLMYQNIVCRLWARSAFYQSGGAYGYRDQLQDSLNAMYISPQLTREQLLLHAAHQFIEGDVQHWWHPKVGDRGVRTRFTDDRLWLPFVLVDYLEGTQDYGVLTEEIPFLEGEGLGEGEDEKYFTPSISSEIGSLYEHCVRAIDISLQFGVHGLPLMGSGDWNDGMSTVGNLGKGESCWLGWFLLYILNKFIPLCRQMNDDQKAEYYQRMKEQLADALEKEAWDGAWYRRAYFDDGTPLGSQINNECSIDSLSQSWAVIAQGRRPDRAEIALKAVDKYLVDKDLGLIKLFVPPFEDGDLEPGYIKGYVAGVRENGAQYTHAATWVIKAFAMLGQGDKAWELFHMINPLNHARTPIECAVYKVEPYVVAADVYTVSPQAGRGGWTWYTGAAGWLYRVGLEDILGFQVKDGNLIFNPCIPAHWQEYQLNYRYKNTTYQILITNPDGINRGVGEVFLDGQIIEGEGVPLTDDGKTHKIKVVMAGVPKIICKVDSKQQTVDSR